MRLYPENHEIMPGDYVCAGICLVNRSSSSSSDYRGLYELARVLLSREAFAHYGFIRVTSGSKNNGDLARTFHASFDRYSFTPFPSTVVAKWKNKRHT